MAKTCKLNKKAVANALEQRLTNLRKEAEPARRGDVDGVHDLRVASRRLRAALAQCAPLLANRAVKPFRQEVRAITKLLGRPRELDVMLGQLAEFCEHSPEQDPDALNHASDVLQARRKDIKAYCARAADIAESNAFTQNFEAALASMKPVGRRHIGLVETSLSDAFSDLRRVHKSWRKSHADGALHRIRIVFKKFRYACELYEPLYGEAMTGFIAALKSMQERLGAWNDWRVLRDEIEGIAQTAPEGLCEALHRLAAAFDQKANAEREAFTEESAAFFAKGSRKNVQRLIHRPARLK